MATTKITRKGQITIPADIRKELGLERGDVMTVRRVEGKVILQKAENIGRRTAGALAHYGNPENPLEPGEIGELAAQAIAEEVTASMKDCE